MVEIQTLGSCRIPGCQCDGRVAVMDWGSEDMTETDDSEYEDPVDRPTGCMWRVVITICQKG